MRELLQHEEGSSDAPRRQRRPAVAGRRYPALRAPAPAVPSPSAPPPSPVAEDARQRLGRRPRGGVVVSPPVAPGRRPPPTHARIASSASSASRPSRLISCTSEPRGAATAARRRRQRHRHRQLRERVDAACIRLRVGDEDRRRRRVALGDGRKGEQGREAVRRRCSTRVGDGRRRDEPCVRPAVDLVARCAAEHSRSRRARPCALPAAATAAAEATAATVAFGGGGE